MTDDSFSSEDFDKLLDDFIASQLQETEDALTDLETDKISETTESENLSPEKTDEPDPDKDFLLTSIQEHLTDQNVDKLATEELRLYNAYSEFISATRACGKAAELNLPSFVFTAADLLPRFRPTKTERLNNDILNAWNILISAQPIRLASLPANASDEQILNFAEKTTDRNLQTALIAYVETLIEIDACEIAYNLRRVKYEKHKIEKKIFEEQQQRQDQMRKYIAAIKKKNFPVDAEMLVNNFFKTFRKDAAGAKKMLENNPATFAPIQFDKIPARFFGMVKPKPEDGIKINKNLGKFLKNLKA